MLRCHRHAAQASNQGFAYSKSAPHSIITRPAVSMIHAWKTKVMSGFVYQTRRERMKSYALLILQYHLQLSPGPREMNQLSVSTQRSADKFKSADKRAAPCQSRLTAKTRVTRTIAPPLGEAVWVPRGTEYCEVEDEGDDLSATVERRSDDVAVKRSQYIFLTSHCDRRRDALVLREPTRVAGADPPLREETDDHSRVD